MKYKTTKKAVNNGYTNKICIPYCGLQNLLGHFEYEMNVAYTTHYKRGWICDIYEIDETTAIITGYVPFGNIHPSPLVIGKYELAAKKIRYDHSLTYAEKEIMLNNLLKEFVEEVTK